MSRFGRTMGLVAVVVIVAVVLFELLPGDEAGRDQADQVATPAQQSADGGVSGQTESTPAETPDAEGSEPSQSGDASSGPAGGEESAALAPGTGSGEAPRAGDARITDQAGAPDTGSGDAPQADVPEITDQARAPEPLDAGTLPEDSSLESSTVPPAGDTAAAGEGDGVPAPLTAPTFDVVRVEPNGDTVLAGTAVPGSTVQILDGETVIGTATANQAGSWVLILETPLDPGNHELTLVARSRSGQEVQSENVVVVAVPEPEIVVASGDDSSAARTAAETGDAPPEDEAALATTEASLRAADAETPLVVLMPREGEGASRVLQQALASQSDGIREGRLVLESVDYDEAGQTIIAGRATPGARLIIYLDGYPLGEAEANAQGLWELVPDRVIEPGLHKLRIDQVDADGKVLARVESPFSRADPLESRPDRTFVIVQPGNSLWRIARATYGRGVRYSVIFEANRSQIKDPDLIYPGQVFRVPEEDAAQN